MIRRRWPRLLAALVGLLWFLEINGGATLNPTYTRWIGQADWMQHWIGWLMYRQAPWGFPLGQIPALPFPVGTTVGYMDGNPIVSVLLKPFSPWLPELFQFIGPWLALCFMLQGYMGALLTSVVTDDDGQQLAGGCLFVLSPVLLARMGHDTLCAHWLLLFLLYLGLREYPDAAAGRRSARLAAATVFLAAGIHPYLAAMCWVLAQAAYLRLWRVRLISLRYAAVAAAATTAGVVAVFAALGYLSAGVGLAAGGFDEYRSDLLALFYTAEWSHLMYHLPQVDIPWEGFGFVGVGGLAAAVTGIAVVVWQRPRPRPGAWIVIVAVGLLAFYSLSVRVHLAGEIVMTSRRLYGLLGPVIGPFRSSGRFIWSMHYLVLLFGIWGVIRMAGANRRSAATGVLAALVAFQAADLKIDRSWSGNKHFRHASMDAFGAARGKYDHLALYPPEVLGAWGDFDEERVYRYMLLAYQLNVTFNSGLSARVPVARLQPACRNFEKSVETGRLDPKTIYVVMPPWNLPLFVRAGARCGQIDGDWICVSREGDAAFRARLERASQPPPGE